jgi:uncharacterized delta-60 repeat protein
LRTELLEDRYLLSAGDLDLGFGAGGGVSVDWNAGNGDAAYAVALAPDGKIVVAGKTDSGPMTGGFDFAVARLLPDGSFDPSFSDDGRVTTDLTKSHDYGYDVAIQPDGKILVVGLGQNKDFAIARYNDDGTLDNSFGRKGKVLTNLVGKGQSTSGDAAHAIALRPDGRIVLAGSSNLPGLTGGSDAIALAQYHPDGTLDTSFGEDISGDGTPDGKVIDDAATLHPLGYQVRMTSMALDGAGGVVVAGSIITTDEMAARAFVTRYEADGIFDTDFGMVILDPDLDHSYTGDAYEGMVIQPNGGIVVAFSGGGIDSDHYLALARLLPNGQFDPTFGDNGIQDLPDVHAWQITNLAVQPDGKIVTSGESGGFFASRHLPDGSLDLSFGGGDGIATLSRTFGEEANDLAIQPDGKIVLTGRSTYHADLGGYADSDFRVNRLEGDTITVTPGITVNPVSGLVTTEDGGSDTFTVVLDTQPTGDVEIDVSVPPASTSEGLLKLAIDDQAAASVTLTFGPSDWNDAQSVLIVGQNDDVADGDQTYTIDVSVDISNTGDTDYAELDPDDVSVTNLDNDPPAGDPNDMYVWDIEFFSGKRGKKDVEWIRVTVSRDSIANGVPEAGDSEVAAAAVTINLIDQYGSTIRTLAGTTDNSGVFEKWINPLSNGTYAAEVVGLTHDTYTWYPGKLDPVTSNDDTDSLPAPNTFPEQQHTIGAAATDLALLAWLSSDSSDDDTDFLANQATDELALTLVE